MNLRHYPVSTGIARIDVHTASADLNIPGWNKGLDELITCEYDRLHRCYHDVRHIAFMLGTLEGIETEVDKDALRLAILFHDFVYQPWGLSNEARSADIAALLLRNIGYERAGYVESMIHCTDYKIPFLQLKNADPGIKLMRDLDLAALALPWHEFVENRKNVLREYAQDGDLMFMTPDLVERQAAFLKDITKDGVYFTAPFTEYQEGGSLEDRAKHNIAQWAEHGPKIYQQPKIA